MELPAFLRFDPAPLRARHDGWTPAAQRRFVFLIARGAGVGEAARSVGRSRQTAYVLRARPGAESFAAAWDAALDFAGAAREARRAPSLVQCGLETLLTPRFYRGRLIGFVQREDHKGALRVLKSLDRVADRVEKSGIDPSAYYDALEAWELSRPAEAVEADEMNA